MYELDFLNGIPRSTIDEWCMECVVCDAWVRGKAQLRVYSRYIRKRRGFWDGFNEGQRLRLRWRRNIPIHALNVFAMRDSLIANAFPEVKPDLGIEVPKRCGVEHPVVFTYQSRKLRDTQFCWWVVEYTK